MYIFFSATFLPQFFTFCTTLCSLQEEKKCAKTTKSQFPSLLKNKNVLTFSIPPPPFIFLGLWRAIDDDDKQAASVGGAGNTGTSNEQQVKSVGSVTEICGHLPSKKKKAADQSGPKLRNPVRVRQLLSLIVTKSLW